MERPWPREWIAPLVQGIHEAGRPYFDHLFGSSEQALAELARWVERPSSEVALERAVVTLVEGLPAGGFLALGGGDLARARRADMMTLLLRRGGGGARGLAERLEGAGTAPAGGFPPVEGDLYYLSKIWVSPPFRGRGLGAFLLDAYLRRGREEGFLGFALDVHSENRAAIELYRRAGFVVAGGEGEANPGEGRYLRMILR